MLQISSRGSWLPTLVPAVCDRLFLADVTSTTDVILQTRQGAQTAQGHLLPAPSAGGRGLGSEAGTRLSRNLGSASKHSSSPPRQHWACLCLWALIKASQAASLCSQGKRKSTGMVQIPRGQQIRAFTLLCYLLQASLSVNKYRFSFCFSL